MNKIPLNIAGLDGGVIIKKGGGGGVTINNQEKSVDITENGTSEVRYDAGYTGLEKVSVKVAIPVESKSVTIIENGTSEVAADEGYLDKVSINVAIPTEEKTIEITENGTTEVVADKGFLNKVIVNTNVASSGGGDTWRYFNVSNVNPCLIEDTFIPSLVKTSDGILSTSTYDGWDSDLVLAVAVDGEMLLSNDNGELVTWNELTNMTQEKLTQLGATEITKEEFYK